MSSALEATTRLKVVAVAVLLSVVPVGMLVVALATRSPFGIVGALVGATAPYWWLRADRCRRDAVRAGGPRRYGREALWVLAALAAFLAGPGLVVGAAALAG